MTLGAADGGGSGATAMEPVDALLGRVLEGDGRMRTTPSPTMIRTATTGMARSARLRDGGVVAARAAPEAAGVETGADVDRPGRAAAVRARPLAERPSGWTRGLVDHHAVRWLAGLEGRRQR